MWAKKYLTFTVNFCRKYSQDSSKELIYEHLKGPNKGIAVFGLNKPEQKNAISMSLLDDLLRATDQIHFENETKVLIIRSLVPGAFCTGTFKITIYKNNI